MIVFILVVIALIALVVLLILLMRHGNRNVYILNSIVRERREYYQEDEFIYGINFQLRNKRKATLI